MADDKKCGHDGCGCSPANGGQYCSEYCQEANSDATDEPCGCGCGSCK